MSKNPYQLRTPNYAQHEEALRVALRNSETLRDINYCLDVLRSGQEVVRAADGSHLAIPLDKTRVAALGLILRTQLKLLDKVLPDLKAVEVTGGQDTGPAVNSQILTRVQQMSPIERATRIIQYLNEARTGVSGETIEGEHEPEPSDPGASTVPGFLST